jgi:hypothetical protein
MRTEEQRKNLDPRSFILDPKDLEPRASNLVPQLYCLI